LRSPPPQNLPRSHFKAGIIKLDKFNSLKAIASLLPGPINNDAGPRPDAGKITNSSAHLQRILALGAIDQIIIPSPSPNQQIIPVSAQERILPLSTG
jgi:hypothetical protein